LARWCSTATSTGEAAQAACWLPPCHAPALVIANDPAPCAIPLPLPTSFPACLQTSVAHGTCAQPACSLLVAAAGAASLCTGAPPPAPPWLRLSWSIPRATPPAPSMSRCRCRQWVRLPGVPAGLGWLGRQLWSCSSAVLSNMLPGQLRQATQFQHTRFVGCRAQRV
jgi:hypothetical protein